MRDFEQLHPSIQLNELVNLHLRWINGNEQAKEKFNEFKQLVSTDILKYANQIKYDEQRTLETVLLLPSNLWQNADSSFVSYTMEYLEDIEHLVKTTEYASSTYFKVQIERIKKALNSIK